MVGDPERKGKEIRVRAEGELRRHLSTGAHLQPWSPSLQCPPVSSFSRSRTRERRSLVFLQSDTARLAPRLRPGPISSPGGRKLKVSTCTCGSGSHLPFFFFPSRCPGVQVSRVTWRMTSRWADVFSRAGDQRVGRVKAAE